MLTNQGPPILGQLQSPALPTTPLAHTGQVLTFTYHGLYHYVEILERFCYKHNKLEFLSALVQHASFLSQPGCKGELLGKSIPILLRSKPLPKEELLFHSPFPPPLPPSITHTQTAYFRYLTVAAKHQERNTSGRKHTAQSRQDKVPQIFWRKSESTDLASQQPQKRLLVQRKGMDHCPSSDSAPRWFLITS